MCETRLQYARGACHDIFDDSRYLEDDSITGWVHVVECVRAKWHPRRPKFVIYSHQPRCLEE